MKKIVLFFIYTVFFAAACQKDKSAPVNPGPGPAPVVDVYVAGDYTSSIDNKDYALYWKNGTPNLVNDLTSYSNAKAIQLDNGHIYMVGMFKGNPCIWKDGDQSILKLPADAAKFGVAEDLLIDNGIIYVVGRASFNGIDKAMLWKYDIATNSVTQENILHDISSKAIQICKSGTQLYVSGRYVDPNSGIQYACYWNWTIGSNPPSTATAFLNTETNSGYDMMVDGAKIFVAGYKPGAAAGSQNGYWELPSPQENFHSFNINAANAHSIALDNNGNIVFAGDLSETINNITNTYATLWQNANPVRLSQAPYSWAEAIAVNGTDIYVAGDDPDQVWVWKGGTKTVLSQPANSTNSHVYDLVLVKK